ncbi:MAG: DUF4355 domain-containing protein [Aeromonadaceae bacterium]
MEDLQTHVEGSETGSENSEKTYTQAELEQLLQKEADRRVSMALAKKEKETQAKIAEAQRLSKMSEADRFQAELDARESALAEKERQLILSQNKVAAVQAMESSGVPTTLVDFVLNEDADVMYHNIKTLKTEIDKQVQAQVAAKIGSGAPTKASADGKLTAEQFGKMSIAEKNRIYTTNPELYNSLTKK